MTPDLSNTPPGYSIGMFGNHLTTEIETDASRLAIREQLNRHGLLIHLDHIRPLADKLVLLVWDVSDPAEIARLDPIIRIAAEEIAGQKHSSPPGGVRRDAPGGGLNSGPNIDLSISSFSA